MAKAKQHTKKGRRRSSFLCSLGVCFGISSKVSADLTDGKSVSGRRRRVSIPVNDHKIPATSEIVSSNKEIHAVEDDEEKKTSDHELLRNKALDVITSEKSKNSSPTIKQTSTVVVHDTWQNHRKLSHSVSLPAIPRQKKEKPEAEAEGKIVKEEEEVIGGEFDSMLGAVIIMVTLVVMLIWGKIWAIVCTAGWFYFIPRFRANLDKSYAIKFKNSETDGRVDFDSWEYKKKVVLQGLLHRNQSL